MSLYTDVQQELKEALGFFWLRVFTDSDFVKGYLDMLTIRHVDIWETTSRLPEYVSRYTIPITEFKTHRIFEFNERDLDKALARYGDDGLLYDGTVMYGQEETLFEVYRYPFDNSFEPEFIAAEFMDSSQILQKDVDYFIEDGYIAFKQDPLKIEGLIRSATVDTQGNPVFRFILWGFSVKEDVNGLCDFFGTMAGICGTKSTPGLKEAINIGWDLRVDGASVQNVHRALSIISNTTYTDKDGLVEEIFTEGTRVFVKTEDSLYSAPKTARVLVGVGSTVKKGDILFDTFSVYRGIHSVPFEAFEAVVLTRGYLPSVSETGLLLPNTLTRVAKTSEGVYSFYLGGSSKDVAEYMDSLNNGDPSFFDLLSDKYGEVPVNINPMKEYQDLFFGPNCFFIKVRGDISDAKVTSQLLAVLRQTSNAGSGFFVIQEQADITEVYDMDGVKESVGVFYNISATETGMNSNETIITSPRTC